MRISVSSIGIDIGPDSELTAADRTLLASLDDRGRRERGRVSIELRRIEQPAVLPPDDPSIPATVEVEGKTIAIAHHRFRAIVEPLAANATLLRWRGDDHALPAVIRTAVGCAFPFANGLVMHAAGVVIDGRAAVFFGPSGAGKSTLAGRADAPLLSDEHVALVVEEERVFAEATGFWGTLEGKTPAVGTFPLGMLVELRKGESYSLREVPEGERLRRLIGVTLVQPIAELWSRALPLLDTVARAAPMVEMVWDGADPRWERVGALVRGEGSIFG